MVMKGAQSRYLSNTPLCVVATGGSPTARLWSAGRGEGLPRAKLQDTADAATILMQRLLFVDEALRTALSSSGGNEPLTLHLIFPQYPAPFLTPEDDDDTGATPTHVNPWRLGREGEGWTGRDRRTFQ